MVDHGMSIKPRSTNQPEDQCKHPISTNFKPQIKPRPEHTNRFSGQKYTQCRCDLCAALRRSWDLFLCCCAGSRGIFRSSGSSRNKRKQSAYRTCHSAAFSWRYSSSRARGLSSKHPISRKKRQESTIFSGGPIPIAIQSWVNGGTAIGPVRW